MSLQFKIETRTLKLGGKERKISYARSVHNTVTSQEQVVRLIEKISAVSSGDVKSVLDTLSSLLAMELAAGRIVELGDLGRFRFSVRSKSAESQKEFTRANLLSPRLLFVPGKALRDAKKNAKFALVEEQKAKPVTPGENDNTPGGNDNTPGGSGE